MAKEVSHKSARQDLRALLEERNKQNAFLREQLAARVERATHLEARLLSTLDTIDELQASTTLELQQAQDENARLVEKLDGWHAVAREADREKSDMSNAVLQLVAKVESCNDYSNWPASRVEFSHDIALHPVQPSRASQNALPVKNNGECTCAQAYSPAIVEELSDSLTREKRAHALMIEEMEHRVTALQARVAIRDTEIARRTATCRCLPALSSVDPSAHLELMSEEEQAHVASRTAYRNIALDSEVSLLQGKVNQGRRSRRSSSRRRVDQCIQTESTSAHFPHSLQHIVNSAFQKSPNGEHDTINAALDTLDSEISQLRKRLTDLFMEKESLLYVLNNGLHVQDTVALLSPRKRRRLERLGSVQASEEPHADRFDDTHADDGRKGRDGFEDVLLLEEECIRLMHSEESLRASLEGFQYRHSALNEENAQLRVEISRLRSGEAHADDWPSPLLLRPPDSPAVDLTFPPLEPDAISPRYINKDKKGGDSADGPSGQAARTSSGSSASSSSSPVTPTSLIDPSEVPLPRTPTFDDVEHELEIDDDNATHDETADRAHPASFYRPSPQPTPPEPEPLLSPERSPRTSDTHNAQEIELELADARADAEMREREIAEVRDLMEDLALRVGDELRGS